MIKIKNEYKADNGKQFILQIVPRKEEHATLATYENGHIFGNYVPCSYIDSGFVIETDIPGWTKLKGYEVVYYIGDSRISAGNPQIFPTYKMAESYKKHYESYEWFNNELFIEEVEYEGVPLSNCKTYNEKEVIDKEHFVSLAACEIGDYFTEEIVNDFMNMMPPVCMRSDCSQIGEPAAHKMNDEGICKATYATFKRIAEDIWEYCGECFRGENVNV